MKSWQLGLLLVVVAGGAFIGVPRAIADPVPPSRAAELFKAQQYADAVKLLEADVEGKPVTECGKQYLMIGESYYLLKQYEKARPFFLKVTQNSTDPKDLTIADYRGVCCAFRLKEYDQASDKIIAFVAKYPDDARVGKVLSYRMMILAAKGDASSGKELEAIQKKIYSDLPKYDAQTGIDADQILCDYYRKTGQGDKAEQAFTRIVFNFRKLIADRQSAHEPVPAEYEKAHDSAALQLGLLALDRKQPADAVKWLENVRFDQDSKQRAKLLLAKVAFEKGDYKAASTQLLANGFIDTVPAGATKSDMFFVLGMAEKAGGGDPAKVEEYLRKVTKEAHGYAQAQSALGDLYLDRNLRPEAVQAYKNALGSADHAGNALFHLGTIYLDWAASAKDPATAKNYYQLASDAYKQLFTKYPLSPVLKQVREKLPALAEKGFDVSYAQGGQDMAATWTRLAKDKPGTFEGAQSLTSLFRMHLKRVVDDASRKVTRAPDYAAAAVVIDQLLDAKVYQGVGFTPDAWKALRADAAYQRGLCELASIAPAPIIDSSATPQYVRDATPAAATAFLKSAKSYVDPKQAELARGIEIALVEVQFKSAGKEDKEAARKRFDELAAEYGNDLRFQALAFTLAGWLTDQKRFAEAAQQYVGIVERSPDLNADDTMKLLFSAGTLYSRAAYDASRQSADSSYAIYIFPKETIDLGDEVLKSYAPLARKFTFRFGGGSIKASAALLKVSQISGVPFVWSTETSNGSIARYLQDKSVQLQDGQYTVAQVLAMILDLKTHRLAFDIGQTDGKPTITIPEAKSDDPALEGVKAIEIFDQQQYDRKFKSLNVPIGTFKEGGKKSGVMLYGILSRIEETTHLRVMWAEGIDSQQKLAAEFEKLPGSQGANTVCGRVLGATLEKLDLRYKVIQRDVASDYYEAAKDAYNKLRKIDPKSKFGEKALFNVAINFYNQKQYDKMKAVLREYLKLFDSPTNDYYHDSNFWVGWALEHEKKFHDASSYYARAAEERLVIFKPADGASKPSPAELKANFSIDTQYALLEPVTAEVNGLNLDQLADWIRTNCHVDVRVDASAAGGTALVAREKTTKSPGLDVICDALADLKLDLRAENSKPEVAERAYYRMAAVYQKDNGLDQALENCTLLLARYPQTKYRSDALRLMLEIYKGQRVYGKVLSTLQELQSATTDDAESRRLAMEMASIHFDMADYAKAADVYARCVADAKSDDYRLAARDGLARSLWRSGKNDVALAEFEGLAKEEPAGLKQYADALVTFYLRLLAGKVEEREFPEEAMKYILSYEKLTDLQRVALAEPEKAKALWIYYVLGLIDLKKGREAEALTKFAAASRSPDDAMAADAAYRAGMIHVGQRSFNLAIQKFENLLFVNHSNESCVRASYALGAAYQQMGKADAARRCWKEVIERYPLSPYVAEIKKSPLWQSSATQPSAKTGTGN